MTWMCSAAQFVSIVILCSTKLRVGKWFFLRKFLIVILIVILSCSVLSIKITIKMRTLRHDDAQARRLDRNRGWQLDDQLPIHFERRRGGAGKGERFRLKNVRGGCGQRSAQKQLRSAPRQHEPVDPRQNTDIQQAIPQVRSREKRKLPAVQAAIADQDESTGGGLSG